MLCEQLMNSLTAPVAEDSMSQGKILRQLASVSGQIKGIESGSNRLSRKNLETKVEGMTNYAPFCKNLIVECVETKST